MITIDDLRRILVECAGDTEEGVPDRDIRDITFEELGYDSLALMETSASIRVEFGVVVPDDRIADLRTPRELLDLVNNAIVQPS